MEEERPDAGFTLLDVMMAMTVMTVVMAVFTASLLAMYRSSNSVEAKAEAQTQLSIGLRRLDHEVRYAAGISAPYALGGHQHLDFLTIDSGAKKCVQLRVRDGRLGRRSWTYRASPLDLTPWTQLTSGLSGPAPLAYRAPTAKIGHQQLELQLTTSGTTGKDANLMIFTALNTDRTSGNDYCDAARLLP